MGPSSCVGRIGLHYRTRGLRAAAAWCLLAGAGAAQESAGPVQPLAGEPAPAFSLLEAAGGRRLSLSSLRGSTVVLAFGASWCTPCRSQMEALEALAREFGPRRVRVLLIAVRETSKTVRAWMRRAGGKAVTALLDADGAVAARYAPADLLPELEREEVMMGAHVVVDRAGVVRHFARYDPATFDPALPELRARLKRLAGISSRPSPASAGEGAGSGGASRTQARSRR